MKFIVILFFIISSSLFSVELKYLFNESYRIESTVYQNVLINNKIDLSSTILNKYSVNIIKTIINGALLDVSHHVFQESKGLKQGFYTAHTSEKGVINQYSNGVMEPESNQYFPAVQNVPQFPDRDIMIGESWTSEGIEYFDLKNGFEINDVIRCNFMVYYNYIGNKIIDNVEVAVISLNYNIFQRVTPYLEWGDFYPVKISCSSKQTLYWDFNKGRPHSVQDKYVLDFYTSTGDKYTFKGNTDSISWPKNNFESPDMASLIQELKNTPKTTVKESETALTITFNSLLFDGDSYDLRDDVKIYLDRIGSNLKKMGDVNIRILGHTAIFGTVDKKYLNDLSLNRSRSVAEYLLSKGYIDINSIEIDGLGGDYPVDTNSTPEGRSNNRRVEIDILKN